MDIYRQLNFENSKKVFTAILLIISKKFPYKINFRSEIITFKKGNTQWINSDKRTLTIIESKPAKKLDNIWAKHLCI